MKLEWSELVDLANEIKKEQDLSKFASDWNIHSIRSAIRIKVSDSDIISQLYDYFENQYYEDMGSQTMNEPWSAVG